MRMSTQGRLVIVALSCSVLGCSNPGQEVLTHEQRQLNDASFDYVWETVRDRHFDPKLNGLDWNAMRSEYKPRVTQAENMNDVRSAMREMLGRLGQSHFGIIPASAYESIDGAAEDEEDGGDPPSAAADQDNVGDGPTAATDESANEDEHGDCGIEIRVLEGQAIVSKVYPGSPGAAAGIQAGWVLVAVNGHKTADVIEVVSNEYADSTLLGLILSRATSRRLSGDVGETVELHFLDGADSRVEMSVVRVPERGERTHLMGMPEVVVWIEHYTVADHIGYIGFNGFFHPTYLMGEFGAAMRSFMGAPGIIIDLRGNGGGIGAVSMGMAGWLVEQKNQRLGTMYMRDNEIRFVVFPRAETYSGPVAVLTDALSASTSEIMAGGLQDLGRVRIFGTRTAGAALPSAIERLPNGDGFQYAIANYVSQGGHVLEGVGVIPDERVELTRAALLAGQDPVVQAAISWIQSDPHGTNQEVAP